MSAPTADGFVRVCALDALQLNVPAKVIADGHVIVVVRTADHTVRALDDRCSHGDISLSEGEVEDGQIECWGHGGRFDLTTGVATQLPAFEPQTVYDVRVEGPDVLLDPHSGRTAAQKGTH